ncbi:DegV family protein [Pediococcus ethanolidurans]|uniref:DegV family protein n=1 Tax=Pediococcus ethanolidurans TaxID=319653 RepID=UPI001C1EB88A|nr:DegV family protein [Pediococcus ethanolidurans]MBU7554561.1 DegV family protein [Pediococcus ethanolidurans]MBU7562960.1 DegV family protein [Pediococcus ethanolidurans]MCT4397266.1 DegV family protein [Pediococcus ethanolidurans]MCV3314830.1 DegV family protein [Pediococcus ethanolidurans]MCV3320955.1 DegV family protein [Pediococcus ethanolidurans]
MKIAVVVDSSANIPETLVQQYHLVVINQPILFGNHLYREGVDLSVADFYEKLRNDKTVPTASQVAMTEMQGVFTNLAKEGYEAAICVGVSGGLSGFITNLKAFAPSVKDLDVYAIDSMMACAAEGNLALLAAKLVEQGRSIHTILKQVEALQKATTFLLIVYNMRALSKTGRIMSRSPLIGAILGTRTILTFNETGRLALVTNAHHMDNAFKKVKLMMDKQLLNNSGNQRISVLDANDSELNKQWRLELGERYGNALIETGKIGPFMGVHTGEKSMGIVWAPDWQTFVSGSESTQN